MTFRSHYLMAAAVTPDDIGAALAALPGAELDHASRANRRYLDTFDRRLKTHGYVLQADELRDRCVLVLRRCGTEIVDWAAATAKTPTSGDDFDNPAMRARIKTMIEARVLLPPSGVEVESTVFRFVDAGGKTTARVIVERYPHVFRDAGRRSPLTALRIQTLKGYEAEAAAVARELDARLPLEPCADDISQVLQAAAGVATPDYTAKPVARLVSGDAGGAAVAKVLGGYRKVMLENEHGMQDDIDIEFLHDFRVAMRRSRSVFNRTRGCFPEVAQRRFKRDFAWLNQATGKHRDLDVFLLKLESFERLLDQDSAAAMEPLRVLLQKERRAEHGKLIRMLKSKRYQRFRRDWGELLENMHDRAPDGGAPPVTIEDAANEAIWRTYKRVRKHSRAVIDIEQLEPMHELRKDCKQLRYLIEAFQTVYPAKPLKRAVGELKGLQDALGDLCDIYVQTDLLTGWTSKLAPVPADAAALALAVDRVKRTLRKRRGTLATELRARLDRFDGAVNRRRYRRIFQPVRSA